MDEKDYTSDEEGYAKCYYKEISDEKKMAPMFGGRCPCSITGNKVFFDGLGMLTRLIFKELEPKQLNLTLEMSLQKDPTQEVTVETSQYLSDKSGEGMLSEKMINVILKGFFVPALKNFYRMHI
ncbi:MAG: hypothetical protein Q8N63_06260 [Nanoarchaeota archaeon]|nr:hypothetical protein [Nanoarchaeota archaeon]